MGHDIHKPTFYHGPLSGLQYLNDELPPESIKVVNGEVHPPLTGYTPEQIASSMRRVSDDWIESFEYRLDGAYTSKRGFPFRFFKGCYVPSFQFEGKKRNTVGVSQKNCAKYMAPEPSMIHNFDRWWVWCLAKVKFQSRMPAKS